MPMPGLDNETVVEYLEAGLARRYTGSATGTCAAPFTHENLWAMCARPLKP